MSIANNLLGLCRATANITKSSYQAGKLRNMPTLFIGHKSVTPAGKAYTLYYSDNLHTFVSMGQELSGFLAMTTPTGEYAIVSKSTMEGKFPFFIRHEEGHIDLGHLDVASKKGKIINNLAFEFEADEYAFRLSSRKEIEDAICHFDSMLNTYGDYALSGLRARKERLETMLAKSLQLLA